MTAPPKKMFGGGKQGGRVFSQNALPPSPCRCNNYSCFQLKGAGDGGEIVSNHAIE